MSAPSPSRNFYAALLVLLLICLLPVPIRITSWLGYLTWQMLVPFTDPLTAVSHALRPFPEPFSDDDPAVRQLREALAQYEAHLAQLEEENAILQFELRALRDIAGNESTARDAFRPLRVRRAGQTPSERGGRFHVNAGSNYGVEVGTVVVIPPTQFAGLISSVSPLAATVNPVTSDHFELFEVRVDLEDTEFSDDPKGTLRPNGNGELVGLFAAELVRDRSIFPGLPVRLDDSKIGEGQAGLLVGTIDRIEPNDANPLHARIIVKPVADPQRARVLYLMVLKKSRVFRSQPGSPDNAGNPG